MPGYWVLVGTVVFLYGAVILLLVNQQEEQRARGAFATVIVQLAEKVAALEERK